MIERAEGTPNMEDTYFPYDRFLLKNYNYCNPTKISMICLLQRIISHLPPSCVRASDAPEEAESLHLVLNRNLTYHQKVRLRKTNFWRSGQIRNAPLTY